MISNAYGQMPDQALPEFTEEDYKKTLQWVALQYNRRMNNVPAWNSGVPVTTTNTSNYLAEYADNLTYIYGSQAPADYSFFTKDANGNPTAAQMIRGLDVRKIFDYLHGQAVDLIDPLPKTINVTAYSEGAISKREDMKNYVSFQLQNKAWIDSVKMETGYGFAPETRTISNPERYFKNFKHTMEIGYERIAKHVTYYNNYQNVLPKAFDFTVIGNLASICAEYNHGQVRWRVVPPECAIVDYTGNYDVHTDDNYGGEITQMTIPELFQAYDWTETEQDELKAIAQNNTTSAQNVYSWTLTQNIYWWTKYDNVPKATVVKAQWVSCEKTAEGQYREVLREGDLIGNKYLRNCKVSPGQVWKRGDKSKKRLKYITLTPNLFMNTSVSLVGIIKRYQNLKDAFLTKCIDMVATSVGKATVIRSSMLPEGLRTPDVISQLKQNRVFVIEGEDTEEVQSGLRLAESVDLTLDPNITLIMDMVSRLEGYMADVLNIPDLVRGQVTNYTSGKQIETSKTESTKGLAYLFKNFQLFEKELLSYSADLMKFMAPDDELGRANLNLIVGDGVTELLSMDTVREMSFEDMLLVLNPNDYLSVEDKAELTQVALQTASSGMPTKVLKNYLALKKSESVTEAFDYMEDQVAMDEQRENEQMIAQQEAAQRNAEIASGTQDQIAARQAKLALQLQQMKSGDSRYKTETDAEVKQSIADLQAKIDVLLKTMEMKMAKENEPAE